MSEREPVSQPQENPQQGPLEKALNLVERRLNARKYAGKEALDRAAQGVARAQRRLGSSPGEVYMNLSQLYGRFSENAQQHEKAEDAQAFSELQEATSQTADVLSQLPIEQQIQATKPQRTSARASG